MREPLVVDVDGQSVVGMLHTPATAPDVACPVVLTCHGINGSRIGPNRAFVRLADRLAEAGVATVRFDYRGAGDSEGESEVLSLTTAVRDAQAVLAEATRRGLHPGQLALVGHSFGSVVAARLATMLPGVVGVSIWSGPTDLEAMHGVERPRRLTGEHVYPDGLDWNGYLLGRRFLAELQVARPVADLRTAGVPVLIVHGTGDEAVPVAQSLRLAQALEQSGQPVQLEIIEGADHSFSSRAHLGRLLQVTVDWLLTRLVSSGV